MNTDNPVMLEDDRVIADDSGTFAEAISVEPDIEATRLSSKTIGCLDAPTYPNPHVEPLDRLALPKLLPRIQHGP